MRAKIAANEFKRLIDNTKKFTGDSSNKLMQYIFLEVDAEAKEIKATALDGYRVSVEYARVAEVDESFKCYVKAKIPKITQRDRYAELSLVDDKAYIMVGDDITGCKQPEGVYWQVDDLIKNTDAKAITGSIFIDAVLLKEALESVRCVGQKGVDIEIRGKSDPVVIRSGERNIKLVLPKRKI